MNYYKKYVNKIPVFGSICNGGKPMCAGGGCTPSGGGYIMMGNDGET